MSGTLTSHERYRSRPFPSPSAPTVEWTCRAPRVCEGKLVCNVKWYCLWRWTVSEYIWTWTNFKQLDSHQESSLYLATCATLKIVWTVLGVCFGGMGCTWYATLILSKPPATLWATAYFVWSKNRLKLLTSPTRAKCLQEEKRQWKEGQIRHLGKQKTRGKNLP